MVRSVLVLPAVIQADPKERQDGMKAKTKQQLRDEITELRIECAALNQAHENFVKRSTEETFNIFFALSCSLRQNLMQLPNEYEVFADLVTSFFAEIKRLTKLDFTTDKFTKWRESFLDLAGFDEATSVVIRQRIQTYYELEEHLMRFKKEGKSEAEIDEAMKPIIKKLRKAEGRE